MPSEQRQHDGLADDLVWYVEKLNTDGSWALNECGYSCESVALETMIYLETTRSGTYRLNRSDWIKEAG